MSTTPFSEDNKAFTDAAHLYARENIYPKVFSVTADKIKYETQESLLTSEKWAALDGQFAIDQIVSVTVDDLRHPISLTIQERFRRPEYSRHKDITITEHNEATNAMGELYKIKAQLFLYGYFNKNLNRMVDCVVVNVPSLLMELIRGGIKIQRDKKNPRSKQPFAYIPFDTLDKAGVLKWRLIPTIKAPYLPTDAEVWYWIKHYGDNPLRIAGLLDHAVKLNQANIRKLLGMKDEEAA